jgi:hypothetical protein
LTRLDIGEPIGMSKVPEVDAFFICYAEGFVQFAATGGLPFVWRSKAFTFPEPVSFGAVLIECSSGLEVKFFCSDNVDLLETPFYTKIVGNGETAFRLPAIPKQKVWMFEFSRAGWGKLRKFEIGSSFIELKGI